MSEIAKLHYITQSNIPGYSHAMLADDACEGGIQWVQIRAKGLSPEQWKKEALEVQAVCQKYGAKLIVNDNPQLASEIEADGVHLGKTDTDPVEARKLLGEKYIIGGTANDFEDIRRLYAAGVDYIGLGPFRFTNTKEKLSPILGLEGMTEIIQKCREAGIDTPIIAIGGIVPADVPSLMQAGIYGVAVASSISNAKDKSKMIKEYTDQLEIEKIQQS